MPTLAKKTHTFAEMALIKIARYRDRYMVIVMIYQCFVVNYFLGYGPPLVSRCMWCHARQKKW